MHVINWRTIARIHEYCSTIINVNTLGVYRYVHN